jgi:carbon-monoxide dehydrogenase small subunit
VPANLIKLRFVLNGQPAVVECRPATRLLDILRNDFNLEGTREGCGHGECGACLVLMNGQAVNSCLVPAFMLADAEIVTIEGIQQLKSFAEVRRVLPGQVFRCGFCASGMTVALAALWLSNPQAGETEIRQALAGNLCSCGSYSGILEAAVQITGRKRRHGRRRG